MNVVRKLLAANWKMHLSLSEARALTEGVKQAVDTELSAPFPIVICPPAPYLSPVAQWIDSQLLLHVGAQNLHHKAQGAYTGEWSAAMLTDVGVEYAIIGHSERRQLFGETDAWLSQKLKAALDGDLKPIFCIGETLTEQEAGDTENVIRRQLVEGVFHADDPAGLVVAYEPVWAIGTGKTATPEYAQNAHRFIRKLIAQNYGDDFAKTLPILYGGSVKASNAPELFAQPDIDGGLIGGASLVLADFIAIAKALVEASEA